MGYVEDFYAAFSALTDAFGSGLVPLAALLGLVGLWLCRALFSGLRQGRQSD